MKYLYFPDLMHLLSILMLLFSSQLSAQYEIEGSESRLRNDIYTLAADSMMGRRADKPGEFLAVSYIENEFRKTGLTPRGEQGGSYRQSFEFGDYIYTKSNFIINGQKYKPGIDFGAVAGSGDGSVNFSDFEQLSPELITADPSPDLQNRVVLLNLKKITASRDGRFQAIIDLLDKTCKMGPSAILIYNAGRKDFENKLFQPDSMPVYPVPIVYLTAGLVEEFRKEQVLDCELEININRSRNKGINIIGLMDNGVKNTVVIGAHYDHIGFYPVKGEFKMDTVIFNGADDNASGTAGMMELARLLQQQEGLRYNYLFIAFGAEEAGLLGSLAFCKSNLFKQYDLAWMLNLDMIGRLGWKGNDKLSVMGLATYKGWRSVLRKLPHEQLNINKIGGAPEFSDHYPFLKKKVPLIYFTTGLHKDYHKVTDDPVTINYPGQARVVAYLQRLILYMDTHEKPIFHKVSGFKQIGAFTRIFLLR